MRHVLLNRMPKKWRERDDTDHAECHGAVWRTSPSGDRCRGIRHDVCACTGARALEEPCFGIGSFCRGHNVPPGLLRVAPMNWFWSIFGCVMAIALIAAAFIYPFRPKGT